MRKLIRLKESRAVRLAASAMAVAAAVAGATGIVAGQGNAAPATKADNASHLRNAPKFKHPKLKHGVLTIKGTDANDKIALRLQAGQPGILQVDVGDDGSADFSFDRTRVAAIAADARAGDDLVRIDETNGVFTDSIATTLEGGDGNDNLAGGSGVERLLGGDGNDSIDGNRGNDLALLGAGDDTFVWDPGDGSDTVEGQDGTDTLLFNGANAAEQINLSAYGNRLKFFRDGANTITVNDLTGTDVNTVNVDLGVNGAGDGQTDHVIVNGTNGNDTINVSGDASDVAVSGLPALVAIQHQEPTDQLGANGRGGNDAISATALAAQAIALTLDGGAGDDT